MRFALLLASFIVIGSSAPTKAQTWAEAPGLLTTNYIATAYWNTVHQDPIAIRSGQQNLFFDPGNPWYIEMKVRVDGGSWETLWSESDGTTTGPMHWANVPTTPGEYAVKLSWTRTGGAIELFDYRLLVVPPAQRAFSDGAGNSMVLWEGTTSALDSPLLVVEGIDADNINVESHYYAIGSELFGLGRSRGADVLVLNLYDGGRDLRLNADVVKRSIQYLNQIKTGSRKLDVAGVSMGGVVTRYTLADMEVDGTPHNVGYFVSIDAPQQGAVVDPQLLNWMYDPPWYADGKFDVPQNIISTAGKQLLQVNPFDTSTPTQHTLFYNELNALNGDGYPHQTTENIGVSFGTPTPNPDDGQWLQIAIDGAPDNFFFFSTGDPEDAPGSLLPEDITNLGGSAVIFWVVDVSFGLVRTANPTFIPYDSALDRVNGQSKFDVEIDAVDQAFPHNVVPPKVIEPLLTRLGYGPPVFTVEIDGPYGVQPSTYATWTAPTDHGDSPIAYEWQYRYVCPEPDPDPPPCNPDKTGACTESGGGIVVPMGPTCGSWDGLGTGYSYTHSFSPDYAEFELRVRVTDDAGEEAEETRTVAIAGGGRMAGGAGTTATGGETVASARKGGQDEAAGTPEVVALEAYPNPVGNAVGSGRAATTVRFGLPGAADIRLVVYDVLGREVARLAEGERAAGWHTARFEAAGLPSGRYVVRLTAGSVVETLPVTVLR